MSDSQAERLARARDSLEGLSVGDAYGGLHTPRTQTMLPDLWYYTDDTFMALSIYSILRQLGKIDQDALAQDFALRFQSDRGYGPGMRRMLKAVRIGGDWRELAPGLFSGQGSFGNGSAMRIAPLGAYYADDLDKLVDEARLASLVTHCHPEGVAGGIAVGVAAGVAASYRGRPAPTRGEFLDQVIPRIPESEVRKRLEAARERKDHASIKTILPLTGNGVRISCQDTAPITIWIAAGHLDNYEEAFWMTAENCRDRDTTCAIVGGIVASYTGADAIPESWRARRESLPKWALENMEYA